MIVALLIAIAQPGSATAQSPVDVELVLAVDVSYSMDLEEQRLQREGYVAAFRDAEVLKAIRSGAHGRISVTYLEWAGPGNNRIVQPWTLIDGPAAAHAFADKLAAEPITRMRMTSISSALEISARALRENPYQGVRRVIDISGDGPNNSGPHVTPVRDKILEEGVVINGLPIMIKSDSIGFGANFDITKLDQYYADCVIGGPGAFVIAIKKLEDFLPAIRRKLILEISGIEPVARIIRTQATATPPNNAGANDTDCLIGERLWQRYYGGSGQQR